MLSRALALLLGLLFTLAAAAAPAPALVVVIIIDGLPHEQVVKYRDLYGPGGFRLFLDRGAWYADAHHGHAVTLTAPGHATVLTGTYPYRNGIISNEWIDRQSFARVYNTGDKAHTYIGEETKDLDGTSPANLRVTTVGDELRYSNGGQSKVLTVSGKDRGAILLAGKRGTAYMYMDKTGRFASTTYYMKEHPAWHAKYYAANPQDKWFSQSWSLLLPEAAYARSTPAQMPWHRPFAGMGTTFPYAFPKADKPGPAQYAALLRTPFADEATLEFVRAAVEGENLGRNPAGVPDLLGISLSTHDYVNHAFGPESVQSQDHLLRLDRALAGFFDWLDDKVGLDKVVMALTADHGFMNSPEYAAANNLPGGRINPGRFMEDLNKHLNARFSAGVPGPGNLAARLSYPTIILDQQLIAARKLTAREVEDAAAQFVIGHPNMATAFTRSQLESGTLPDSPLKTQVLRAWNRDLSGDLYLVQKPGNMFGSTPVTHGSPYTYDTNIPFLFYGRRWIESGKQSASARVADLAPTLSWILDIRQPSGSEGRVLTEILKR